MASVDQALRTRLINVTAVTNLTSTRIYPGKAPVGVTYPYITFSMISAAHQRHMTNAAGLSEAVFQLDIWSNNRLEAVTVAEQVRLALDHWSGTSDSVVIRTISLLDERDELLPATDASDHGASYRRQMDFSVWHQESVPS